MEVSILHKNMFGTTILCFCAKYYLLMFLWHSEAPNNKGSNLENIFRITKEIFPLKKTCGTFCVI